MVKASAMREDASMLQHQAGHAPGSPPPVTQPDAGLNEIISRSHHLFLDFDGPICAFFAGLPAGSVARDLRAALLAAGVMLPAAAEAQDDPLEVFRIVAGLGPEAAELAQRELTSLET